MTDHDIGNTIRKELPLAYAEGTGSSIPIETIRSIAQGSSPSWDQLDKRYYYGLMPIAPFIVRLVTFPSNLVKTRLQSAPTLYPYTSTANAFKTIMKKQGLVGLYRGMGFNMIGMIQDPIYMTTMELTKGWLFDRTQASAVSFFSGSLAAILVLSIAVPVDVITQRLMIQQHPDRQKAGTGTGTTTPTTTSTATSTAPRPVATTTSVPSMAIRHMQTMSGPPPDTPSSSITVRSGLVMLRDTYNTQGVSGVYRGLGTSMFLYVPFCGILWSTFAGSRVITDQMFAVQQPHHHVTTHVQDAQQKEVRLMAIPQKQPVSSEWRYMASLSISALIAGVAASALTNPIDVLRTRLQVSCDVSPSFVGIYRGMVSEHGGALRGLTSGLFARILAGGPTNAILVSAYEIIKLVSVKNEE